MNAAVQPSVLDRTKGPVGLSGTVLETSVVPARVAGDMVGLVVTIACNEIRCRVTTMYESNHEAREAQRQLPAGAHLTAFGEASNLQLRHGELHLSTQRVITYALVSDFTQRGACRELF